MFSPTKNIFLNLIVLKTIFYFLSLLSVFINLRTFYINLRKIEKFFKIKYQEG